MTNHQRTIADQQRQSLDDRIARIGYATTNVLGTQFRPDMSYTTGFLLAGHPELLVFGFDAHTAGHLIHRLFAEVRAGTPRAVGPDAANELEGIAIRLLPVPAEFWQEGNHLMLGFPFFYADKPHLVVEHSVLQVVVEDGSGRFPWDDGVHAELRRDQPVLALGHRPVRRPALPEPPDNRHLCVCCQMEAAATNRRSRRGGDGRR